MQQAVATKRRKYADVASSSQACLLVLGCETYGRWCAAAISIVRELATLKARQALPCYGAVPVSLGPTDGGLLWAWEFSVPSPSPC